jgi:hypothetical protein
VSELKNKTAVQLSNSQAANVPVVATESSAALSIRRSAAVALPYVAYGAARIGRAGIIGLALCIFSLITFLSGNLPLRQQVSDQSADLALARDSQAPGREHVSDKSPQAQANRFVASLPGRNDVPAIMGSVITIAAASGIELEHGSYEYLATDDAAIARYRMTLPVSGSYPQVRKFVENLLATVPAIALDSIRIERDNISDQTIAADLRFSVLLESGT